MMPVVKLHVSMKQAADHSDHVAAWYGTLLCFNPKHYATKCTSRIHILSIQSSQVCTAEPKCRHPFQWIGGNSIQPSLQTILIEHWWNQIPQSLLNALSYCLLWKSQAIWLGHKRSRALESSEDHVHTIGWHSSFSPICNQCDIFQSVINLKILELVYLMWQFHK